MRWNVLNGGIFFQGAIFAIKGLNWFGFEDCSHILHGLSVHPMTWYLDFMQNYNFNVIRVPISQQWLTQDFNTTYPPEWTVSADPSLQHKTSLEILDTLFEEAKERGIFIMLDMHRLGCEAQSHELWYSLDSPKFTDKTFFSSWQMLIDRYSNHSNFHGIDLLNEPRGLATWSNDPRYSWKMFVEHSFSALNYSGLIYVEGLDWGRTFADLRENPLQVPENRIVYSPHVYGPSVVGGLVDLDPARLHGDWNNLFGFLVTQNNAVVIGEFGGRYDGADEIWQNELVSYLRSTRIPGIYWALNPDSTDTGGLLQDDWTTPRYDKLALLERLQPNPTLIAPSRLIEGAER